MMMNTRETEVVLLRTLNKLARMHNTLAQEAVMLHGAIYRDARLSKDEAAVIDKLWLDHFNTVHSTGDACYHAVGSHR